MSLYLVRLIQAIILTIKRLSALSSANGKLERINTLNIAGILRMWSVTIFQTIFQPERLNLKNKLSKQRIDLVEIYSKYDCLACPIILTT